MTSISDGNGYHPQFPSQGPYQGTYNRGLMMPFAHTSRRKPRRWPLALRFIKGAIHGIILVPVILHTLFAALIVFIDQNLESHLGLSPTIIPSLSIVVGLMLVFRNQTSYNRFLDGGNLMTAVEVSVRNLTRLFLVTSYEPSKSLAVLTQEQRDDTESAVKMLIALLYTIKTHLRGDWGADFHPPHPNGTSTPAESFADLVPPGVMTLDHRGLGMTLQLTFLIEQYIKRGIARGWYGPPQASLLSAQLSSIVDSYSKMEQIRLTPLPVALLIHHKQVLALFGMVLPFALTDEMGWWAVPIVTLVIFTLYGIEGIGSQLEDPFGTDKIDIQMDALVEDLRVEIEVLLDEWRRVGNGAVASAGLRSGASPDEVKWFVGDLRRRLSEMAFRGINYDD
ncbi:hypothetical protein MMC25_007629 [Agyrium rufum]|nr:hypothetical protein [Agyrium rufum]